MSSRPALSLSVLLLLSACQRNEPPTVIVAPAGEPGTPGTPGPAGATGETGKAGPSGSVVVVLPPASAASQ